jgi:hypothetical protein
MRIELYYYSNQMVVYDNIFIQTYLKKEVTRKVDKNLFMGKDLFLIEGQYMVNITTPR